MYQLNANHHTFSAQHLPYSEQYTSFRNLKQYLLRFSGMVPAFDTALTGIPASLQSLTIGTTSDNKCLFFSLPLWSISATWCKYSTNRKIYSNWKIVNGRLPRQNNWPSTSNCSNWCKSYTTCATTWYYWQDSLRNKYIFSHALITGGTHCFHRKKNKHQRNWMNFWNTPSRKPSYSKPLPTCRSPIKR